MKIAAIQRVSGPDPLRNLLTARHWLAQAAAQGGTHENGRSTWGHSMRVDPWGQIMAQQPQGEGLVLGEVLGARLQELRRRLPALAHRML